MFEEGREGEITKISLNLTSLPLDFVQKTIYPKVKVVLGMFLLVLQTVFQPVESTSHSEDSDSLRPQGSQAEPGWPESWDLSLRQARTSGIGKLRQIENGKAVYSHLVKSKILSSLNKDTHQ